MTVVKIKVKPTRRKPGYQFGGGPVVGEPEIVERVLLPRRAPDGKILPGGPAVAGAGRRHNSRNKLSTAFIEALSSDFDDHGAEAIRMCRMFNPDVYIKVIAGMLPKEVHISQEHELSDDELDSALKRLLLADIAETFAGREGGSLPYIEGTTVPQEPQSAGDLQAVQEAGSFSQ